MPATSSKQRTMFCVALSIKEGKTPKSYSKQGAKMANEMSIKQLSDFCKQPIKEK